jgi:ABC-type spermidine/putrescine transport system permease subunit I
MLVTSVTDPQLSLAHYRRIFTVPLYTQVMLNTFVTSLIVTALCLVLGYPSPMSWCDGPTGCRRCS